MASLMTVFSADMVRWYIGYEKCPFDREWNMFLKLDGHEIAPEICSGVEVDEVDAPNRLFSILQGGDDRGAFRS